MTKTIQLRVNDFLKTAADELFLSLGLDTSTAIRIFLAKSIETGGIPFDVRNENLSLDKAIEDVTYRKNLSKPYTNAKDAIDDMLRD